MLLIPESVLYLCATSHFLVTVVSRNAGHSIAEYGYNNKIFAGVSRLGPLWLSTFLPSRCNAIENVDACRDDRKTPTGFCLLLNDDSLLFSLLLGAGSHQHGPLLCQRLLGVPYLQALVSRRPVISRLKQFGQRGNRYRVLILCLSN